MTQITDVVAALICRGNKFLICRRPAHKARGLLWEFVGGKRERGETLAQALVRECREELAVTPEVGELYCMLEHRYPDIFIRLSLFRCTIGTQEPQMLEHADLRWITPGEIGAFEFCPADAAILQKLKKEGI